MHVSSLVAVAALSAEKRQPVDLGFSVEIELKDGKAPGAFRIFRAGENPSTKGTYLFDESSQAACMAYQTKRGMDTMVDYEHASRYATFATDPQKAGRAAAWCRLECKNGELWATKVDWTAAGRDAVETKEQRFFSPVFGYNRETMVVGECVSIGLTSTPALDNLQPLAAKNDGLPPEPNVTAEELKQFLASLSKQMALKSDAGVIDVQLAVAELVQGRDKLFAALSATSVSDAVGKIEGLKANGARVAELTASIAKTEADAKKTRVGTLIEAALTANKVTPAQKPFLEKMGEDEATLKAYIDTLQPLPGSKALTPNPVTGALPLNMVPSAAQASLRAEDLHVAQLMGYTSPEQLQKFAELRARGVQVGPLTPKA